MTQQKQLKSGSSATKQICLVDAAYDLNINIIEYGNYRTFLFRFFLEFDTLPLVKKFVYKLYTIMGDFTFMEEVYR